jgi:hypothetical protein
MLCAKQFYVNGVSVRHRVRGYSLILLRESSPPRAMFCVHYSSTRAWIDDVSRLARLCLRLALASVSRRAKRGFPQALPFTTLTAFGVGNDLPYSATASAWAEQRREELRNAI